MAAKKRVAPPQPVSTQESVVRPITHLSLKQWPDHPDLQRKLRAIIEDPIFLLAHNTLINAAFPGWEPSTRADAGVSAEAFNGVVSHRYAHRSGMGYSFRMLKFLTAEKSASTPGNPYGDLLPEDE